MKHQRRFDEDLVVLRDEKYPHAVLPKSRRELARKLQISGKVEVAGGIWCRELEIEAHEAFFKRSVYAAQQINLVDGDKSGCVCFNGLVASGENIVIAPEHQEVYFAGGIATNTLRLKNALVIGNIHADKAHLERCAVFGNIISDEAKLTDCIIASSQVKNLEIERSLGLLFPFLSAQNISMGDEARIVHIFDFNQGRPEASVIFEIDADRSVKQVNSEDGQCFDTLSAVDRIFDFDGYKIKVEQNLHRILRAAKAVEERPEGLSEIASVYRDCFYLINTGFLITDEIPVSKFYEMEEEDSTSEE